MSTAMGVDATYPVAIPLAEHCHAARREQDFHRVMSYQHPRRVRLRQAVGEDEAGAPSPLLGEHVLDLFCGYVISGGRITFYLGILVADFRGPHTAPLGELSVRLPNLTCRTR